PKAYLQQALLEERTRSVVSAEHGLLGWVAGPATVAAERTISGDQHQIEGALGRWMTEEELLQVKRRYPDRTSWEAQQGMFASLKRGLGMSGRRYVLTRAHEITGQVTAVQTARCHVALIADVAVIRGQRVAAAGITAAFGTAGTVVLYALHFATFVTVAPLIVFLPLALSVGRMHRGFVHHMQVALEQVLDILEHREMDTGPQVRAPRASAFVRIADEIRKSLNP
ncbi:MAG TPA: hypothetical protein VGI83_08090, partial [Gemmatimonadales bacterium]